MTLGYAEKGLGLATIYGGALAVLHLFGFWGGFGINPLEFMSLTDLVARALYPLLVSSVIWLLFVPASQLWLGKQLPPGAGADTRVGRLGRKHWRELEFFLLVITIFAGMALPDPHRWLFVAMLMAVAATPLSGLQAMQKLVPRSELRSVLVFVLVFGPPGAFYAGRIRACNVKAGRPELLVDVSRSTVVGVGSDSSDVAFLGRLGDQLAGYDTAKSTVVLFTLRDGDALVLCRR